MQIAIVFNPRSGKRAAASGLSSVVGAIASHNHQLIVIDCQKQPDFGRELQQLAAELDRVIVIGGDGTLSSVVNAVMNSSHPELPVAFVPTGRGRDTARSLPSWDASQLADGAFERADIQAIDLVKTSLASGNIQYAINISSIGLGAHAAAVANGLPRALGTLSYIAGAVRGFLPPRPFMVDLDIDGDEHHLENVLLVAACNGKAFGGGIYLVPEADQQDGLIDLVVIHNANLGDLALQLGKLKAGTLHEHPALTRFQGASITIAPVSSPWYEADGEALSSQPVLYETAPKALNWIVP